MFSFKSSRIERIYLTSNEWPNVSGLSSVLLSRFDGHLKNISIVGPSQCSKAVGESTRFDTKLRRMNYDYIDKKREDYIFNDGKLLIEPIVFDSGRRTTSIAYFGRVTFLAGCVSLDKCFKLRVPRDKVAHLERGESVQLANGQLVQPQDVCERDQPERAFLIFEVTDEQTIELMWANKRLQEALMQSNCLLHFTSDQFLAEKRYRQLFADLPSSTYHLLITESNPSMSLYSTHSFQNQLNHIDSVVFPKLKETPIDRHLDSSTKVIQCPAGLTYNLRIPPDEDEDLSLARIPSVEYEELDKALCYQDGEVREGLEQSLAKLREAQQSLVLDRSQPAYPEFLFLGTASSLGLPIRNVTSILVNITPHISILLDCGEGTYGQLMRFYGREEGSAVLERIKMIFISHHHSDHHLGLIELLGRMKQARPLLLLPPSVATFITRHLPDTFPRLSQLKQKYGYLLNNRFDASKLSLKSFGLANLCLVPVDHCAYAFGVTMTTAEGYKFVFSGDTMPCARLIEAGHRCDLLIHEATVEDELANFARANFHSTISQAFEVSKRMEASFTMFTHFSQRYGKLPYTFDEWSGANIGLAYDNMLLTPRTLPRVPLMPDTLKVMYGKHLVNISYRTELYRRRSNRVDGSNKSLL